MGLVETAIHFATDAFVGQTRKCTGLPAILHSLETAAIVSSMTNSECVIAAAVLHDVLEDCNVTEADLRERFGDRVTELVLSETDKSDPDRSKAASWQDRKEASISRLREASDYDVYMLYLADKLSNLRSINACIEKYGDRTWEAFNQKNPEAHYWYYNALGCTLVLLNNYPAWEEYNRLVRKIFIDPAKQNKRARR